MNSRPAIHSDVPADLIAQQRRVIESAHDVMSHQARALEAADLAIVSFHAAVVGALKLLDQGQAAQAREVIASLAAAPVRAPAPEEPVA